MAHERKYDDELPLQADEFTVRLYIGDRCVKRSYDEQTWAKIFDSIVFEEQNKKK